ncbi:MAG: toll/interleukin-1 receptor domain-containing protein [Planctomycetota bacterium]
MAPATPHFRKRKYDAFVSYAHADAPLARRIVHWLKNIAGLKIWFDEDELGPGQPIVQSLLDELDNCRGAVILATENAGKSDHVFAEFNHARETMSREPDFSLIIITPDVKSLPTPFKTASGISCTELNGSGWLSLIDAAKVLSSVAGFTSRPTLVHQELFVSRSENAGEREHADIVCKEFVAAEFGLVTDIITAGDWRNRVNRLMSEVHGHLVILPPREIAKQQCYLEEVRMSAQFGLPIFVCAHPNAQIPDELSGSEYFVKWDGIGECWDLEEVIRRFQRGLRTKTEPAEVFLACQYRERRERNELLRAVIERATSRFCRIGSDHHVYRPELTGELIQQVLSARLVIADVASEVDADGLPLVNLNTCIETGIAIGANREHIVLVRGSEDTKGKTDALPFMLRNCQILYYEDDIELLGKLHRALTPFRRRLVTC